jgi:hypothetical protein
VRKYEWMFIILLVVIGLLCLIAAGTFTQGLGTDPVGGASPFSVGFMQAMPYLMAGCLILWLWAVGVLIKGHLQERSQRVHCVGCGRITEPDWKQCPYCGQRVEKRT